ncbi:non-ribosomal peptide synthetase [Micromonospora okii]|uniref:non-ribosomal peptide synthetase n=1 Tax=Micromonospora okii TaxID=1182970 RepID=UPI001E60EA80|nr:non-ribosomal peptide synthetase [Micromonospora okii]
MTTDATSGSYEASPLQQRLWTLAAVDDPVPVVQSRIRLPEEIDAGRLRSAARQVVDRHEALRTVLAGVPDGGAAQVVRPTGSAMTTAAVDGAGGEDGILAEERTAVDPVAGPGFRILLLTGGTEGPELVLTAHAAIADRLSLRIVARELAALCAGDPLDDATPPLQYADYAAWHRDLLTSPDTAADRAAWARHLAEITSAAGAGRRLRGDGDPAEGDSTARVGPVTTGVLDVLAAERGLPVERLIAALFALVCARFTGGPAVVDLVEAGRGHEALRSAVGSFARGLPALLRLDADAMLVDVVDDFDSTVSDLVDRLDHLDPAATAVSAADLWFGFEYLDLREPCGSDWRIVAESTPRHAPVDLVCRRRDDVLELSLRHTGRALSSSAAAAMLAGVGAALAEAAQRRLDGTAATVELLDAAERGRILALGRGAEVPGPGRTLHDLIAEVAQTVPRNVAVSDTAGELSYAELQARADQLAHHLRARGVTTGDRVVVRLPRTVDLLVAVLGTLRAGAAFVPVDPMFPDARLAHILQDAGAVMVLCDRPLPDVPNDRTLLLADRAAEIAAPPAPPPDVVVGPADPAYVLYTSGTTGVPQGVVVPHLAAVNYLRWAVDAYDLRAGSGVLMHSSIGFDFGLTTLLAPLLAGQRVLMVADGTGVTGIAEALRSTRDATLVKLTPTHLEVVGQLLTPAELRRAVRTLVVGGEALDARVLSAFREAGVPTYNEYGPTETVVGSTVHRVPDDAPTVGPVPIGRPVANTQVYLTEPGGTLVPFGAVGEICIGGDSVSDGYLNRPELTARRFVAHPESDPPARMYRTGDLGRWSAAGELEYLGRIDRQIKIQGVRVEPAEIEAVLRDCPAVSRAAVVLRHDEPSGSSPLAAVDLLVAYVVPAPGAAPRPDTLVRFCRERLPEQLVPKCFVTLAELPQTPNGKLDHAALPRPDLSARPGVDFVAPRTEAEEILAGAIAGVLNLDAVGIDDNYFSLGGDSIRSVMVTSRAQARGVPVTVADLHTHLTVRACAARLGRPDSGVSSPATKAFDLLPPAERDRVPDDVEDVFPLNLLQEGMIFHRDFAAKSAVYHAIASIRLRAPFHHGAMRTAVDQLVARHPMLRTSFDMTTFSQPMQLVHVDFESPLYLRDLRALPPERREQSVLECVEQEKARGFELHEYPLIRFIVQRLTDDEWQFTYGFHHEIIDGWSEAVMITELFSHYFSIVFDEPVTVKPPTSTMRDAVALELEALRDSANYEFWARYLAGATVMRLPRFGQGPAADKGARDIRRIEVPMSVELSDRLKRLAVVEAVPLKNVLLAAHLVVMSTYGGEADTLTYTVGNGRPETADGSSAIGLFVNSLALRVPTGGGTWRELIHAGLASERASLPHRRLPMAELKRHQGSEPLAETLFFFTDYHVFGVLDRWTDRGVSHVATELYGESTFPFCAIFRLNRETGHLEIRLEYDGLQFTGALMDGLRDCYAQALRVMTEDPDSRYDGRSFAPREEQARIVDGDASGGAPDHRRLHDLVWEQVVQRPDAVAVQLGDSFVTYRELGGQARRLSRRLRARGVGAERVVGVLLPRSELQLVAILAAVHAGGAYLPLDPELPDDRLAAVVANAGCTLVLTDGALAARVPSGVEVLSLDQPVDEPPPAAPPAAGAAPANAAYLIYTSGSSGEPKGVVVEHRQAVASTLARHRRYPQPVDRFLLLSPIFFDSSVAGVYWTLSQGGTLLLPAEGLQREPAALLDLIARDQPTHTLAIPALLTLLLDQAAPGQLASLRTVISAGEACPEGLVRAVARQLPGSTLHNEYGPTEATVWATAWSAPSTRCGTDADPPQVPIGRPVPGCQVLPLNHAGHLTPVGVTGELHIGGHGIARGYLGRPGATAAAFRPDRHAGRPGARCYATGDLGRLLPDGDLDFQGRADQQVKIQGFRVELGAVETVLDAHPAIRRSIAVATGQAAEERMLVAYVVPWGGEELTAAQVQRHVWERLPKYMVPGAVVVMDALPLTATGKVDRAALPSVTEAHLGGGAGYTPPRTELEQAIVAIWCRVLRLNRVGVHQSFFDLGGESLRAMQVVVATNNVFGTTLSVRRLFDRPTVSEFAEEVATALAGTMGPADRDDR